MNAFANGQTIEYDRFGNGNELVVILHGWGCGKEMFSSLAKQLSDKYTVVVPDLCGFGKSPEPRHPFSVDDYTDTFTEFIGSLGFNRVSLVGHSYGGRIILKMFTRENKPFEIVRVMLVDSAGIKPKKSLAQKASLLCYKCGRRILSTPPLKSAFPNAVEKWRARRGSADYNSASEIMKKTLVLSVNEDLTYCLKSVTVPTLLFWGENDSDTPISDAKIMEKRIPDAGLVTVRGGSHFSFLDDPALFARVTKSFFELS